MEKIEYTSANGYLRKRFGVKVYKVALDAGFTCPNRDGTLGNNGCIFCSKGGSGEFAGSRTLSISEQLSTGKAFIKNKLPKEQVRFIAYFQAFTNTYGPVERLRELYLEAAKDTEVCAISIATRPDCLPKEVLDLLSEINAIKPVFVELGLQTIHSESAKFIRRGYELPVYDKAVKELKDRGLEVITHVILGLPNESKEQMLETVKYVAESGAKGIKLQLLHVLKGTDLCDYYEAGNFNTLTMEEYIDIVCDCLKLLPKEMVVHRITGDGDKKLLCAPLWSMDKKRVLNEFNRRIVPI